MLVGSSDDKATVFDNENSAYDSLRSQKCVHYRHLWVSLCSQQMTPLPFQRVLITGYAFVLIGVDKLGLPYVGRDRNGKKPS